MATIQWASDASGLFSKGSNWTGGAVPGAADFADIFTAGYDYFTVTSATSETISSLFVSNYANLDITGGGMNVTKSLSVEGTITVETSASLEAGPTFINTGEIDLFADASHLSSLFLGAPVVSLTGAGVVNMGAGGVIFGSVSTDTLINASTIAGGGKLGEGIMGLANQAGGVIDGSAGMVVFATGVVVNGGLIEATGGGVGLTLSTTTVENRYGTIAANGGTLVLANAVIDHGVLTTSAGGTIVTTGNGVVLDGVAYGLTNAGTFQLQGELGMTGTITNSGEFLEPSGASAKITLLDDVNLTGAGTLAFNSNGINGVYSAAGKSYTLTNSSTILGHVAIGESLMSFTNAATGVIDAQGGGGGGIVITSNYTVVNAGLMEATGAAVLELNHDTVDNTGGVILAAAGSVLELIGGTIASGAVSIAAGGTLLPGGAGVVIDFSGGGSMTNAGLVDVGGSVDLVIKGGTVQGAGGEFLAVGGAAITFEAVSVLGGAAASNLLLTDATSTIAIDNGSVLQTQGLSNNTGTIAITSTGALTDLRILAGGATFNGGGTIAMSGAKARILGATPGATLTNVHNTITGVGVIGANNMTLINDSVIEATGLLTVRDAAGHTLTNSGLMEADATGKLALVAETINQAGGGTILAAGGLVTLQGVDVVGGTLVTTGAGRINVNGGGATLDGTLHAVTNAGLLQDTAGQTLTVEGSIINSGKLNPHKARVLVAATGVTLSGGGQVNLNDNATNIIVGASAAATLTNVDNRIDGAGLVGGGVMTLINQAGGVILGNQGIALTLDTGANTILNAGLIENVGKGGTLVKSAVHNTGTLKAITAGTLTLAGAVTGAGVGQINGGTLYVQQAFAENVAFTGSTGVLELGASQAFTGQVAGLSKTGTSWLDLTDIAFHSATTKASYSGTTTSGTLTVTDGTHAAKITLIGNYTGSIFTVSNDGHGGTKVVDPQAPGAPSAAFTQAMAGFQHGPPPHLAGTPAYRLARFPLLHARA